MNREVEAHEVSGRAMRQPLDDETRALFERTDVRLVELDRLRQEVLVRLAVDLV